MIQMQSSMEVADNSGAKRIVAITILGQKRRYAKVGDIVTVWVLSVDKAKGRISLTMKKPKEAENVG